MIHAGGESSRLHDRVLLRAGADPARYRGYFGCPAVRACFPYANCRDGRQTCGAPGQADSRQRKPAAFVRREKSRRPFPLSFRRRGKAARNGSPMLPRTSVSMPRPPSKRCISASAGLREPSPSFAAAPVPDERRHCLPVRSSMFLTGGRRQLPLRRAPSRRPAREPWATGTNPSNRVRQRPRSARRGRAPEAAAIASKRSCAARKPSFAS